MKKKTLLLAAASAAAIGGLTFVVSPVSAQAANGIRPAEHMGQMIEKIATRFNLDEAEVQALFDEDRAEHQAEMEQGLEDKLAALVADGTLTAEQKQLLLDKHAELQAERESWEPGSMADKTPEERRAEGEARRAELETWAEENGIDVQYLRFADDAGRRGPQGGFGKGGPAPVSE